MKSPVNLFRGGFYECNRFTTIGQARLRRHSVYHHIAAGLEQLGERTRRYGAARIH
jgi:hypothetical protein